VSIVDFFQTARRIVDIARDILVKTAEANRHSVAERKIQHRPDIAALPAMGHALTGDFRAAGKFPKNRRLGDELQQAAFAVGAVQGSLRASQNFNPLQIPRIEIATEDGAVEQRAARPER
jgi:hypothetical protein